MRSKWLKLASLAQKICTLFTFSYLVHLLPKDNHFNNILIIMLLTMYYTGDYYTNSILWDKRVHLQVDQLSGSNQQVVLDRQATYPVSFIWRTQELFLRLNVFLLISSGPLFACSQTIVSRI